MSESFTTKRGTANAHPFEGEFVVEAEFLHHVGDHDGTAAGAPLSAVHEYIVAFSDAALDQHIRHVEMRSDVVFVVVCESVNDAAINTSKLRAHPCMARRCNGRFVDTWGISRQPHI